MGDEQPVTAPFHLPFDELAPFLTRELSRNFVLRNDYGLFEYTAYVYR